jgi:hypothetical protein
MLTARIITLGFAALQRKVLVAGGGGDRTLKAMRSIQPHNKNLDCDRSDEHPHRGHTATVLQNGNVLVAGGQNDSAISMQAELFNPTRNTLAKARPTATRRFYHTATLLPDGKVLVVGG